MTPQHQFELLQQILQELTSLKKDTPITSVSEPLLSEEMPINSKEQKDIFSAIAKAQTDMPIATKSSINPYFKTHYASFSDIIKASRNSLSKNGISVAQVIVDRENGQKYLYTKLMHNSGQFIASRIKIAPAKSDIQELGKYISYLKRYSYASLAGIADSMEDDDGETSMKDVREERTQKSSYHKTYKPTPIPSEETISRDQLEQLNIELDECPDIVDMVLDGFKIQALADIPKQQFNFVIKRVRQIKSTKEKGNDNGKPQLKSKKQQDN